MIYFFARAEFEPHQRFWRPYSALNYLWLKTIEERSTELALLL
jgi:hypothetical protein